MSDRLPPLTALRAFEAAARHLSFQKAAAELFVTPAALSYQIKNLEAHLGQPLFRRLNRAVELTEAGRALYPGAREGFEALSAAWRSARRVSDTGTLNVTAGPAFTAKWLAPRMFTFARENPDIEMRFSASLKIMDFERDEIDVAIRFGLGSDEGLHSETLIEEWVTPMLHHRLAEDVKTPQDLLALPLLHDDSLAFLSPVPGWAEWFAAAGVEGADVKGTHFSQADHAIDAALEQAGVVMGRVSICERDLRNGRLVAPFSLALRPRAMFRLVCPNSHLERPPVRRFIDWIKAETAPIAELSEGRDIVDLA
ncbi:MAG: transcriptional regulator GcvA [Rubricella sp.]